MPEPAEQTAEQVKSYERVTYKKGLIGLQSRLLLGDDALKPDNKIVKSAQELEQEIQDPTKRSETTYRLLAKASTGERNNYWATRSQTENELNTFDTQKAKWVQEMVALVNDQENEDYISALKNLKLGQGEQVINFSQFNEQEAAKLFTRYFADGEKQSNSSGFIEDIIRSYAKLTKDPRGNEMSVINHDNLKKDLSAIQWLANIFGDKSSEIIAQLSEAETILSIPEKQKEFITNCLKGERIDNLLPREKELLEFLAVKTPTEVAQTQKPETETEPSTPTTRKEGEGWKYERLKEPRVFPDKITYTQAAKELQQKYPDKYGNVDVEVLTQKITDEQSKLQSALDEHGLTRDELRNMSLGFVDQEVIGHYRDFVESTYGVKLPKTEEIHPIPISGLLSELYNPSRRALAFVTTTAPYVFLDAEVIAKSSIEKYGLEWFMVSKEQRGELMKELIREIKPHEFTHMYSDLAIWKYYKRNLEKELEVIKTVPAKVGLQMVKVRETEITAEGDLKFKAFERGRGLMEAVTVELTDKWAKKMNTVLDIPAYHEEREVLHALTNLLAKEQNISEDEAFKKFVHGYFTPVGFRNLVYEVSGKKVEKVGNEYKRSGQQTRPHAMEVIYAFMEYEQAKYMNAAIKAQKGQAPPPPEFHYYLTLGYLNKNLSDAQKQEIGEIIKNPAEGLQFGHGRYPKN